MIPDNIGITRVFPEFEEIILVPVYDEHIGAISHLDLRWKTIKNFLLETPNAFCTIGGDTMNNSIVGSKASPYQDKIKPSEQKEWLVEEYRPLVKAGKIICVIPGNHEGRSAKDVDAHPLYDVACRLGIEHLYRNVRCFTKITLGERHSKTNKAISFMGVNIHGSYGGKTAGAVISQLERLVGDFGNADYIFAGHAHKGGVAKPTRFIINPFTNTVTEKDILVLAATPGVGYEEYAAQKNYTPASSDIQYVILKHDSTKPDNKKIQVLW